MKILRAFYDYELALGADVDLASGMVTLRFNTANVNPWDENLVLFTVSSNGNDAVAMNIPRECITFITGVGDPDGQTG